MTNDKGGQGETVTVRITGRGIDLSREIDIGALPQIMSFLFSSRGPVSPPDGGRHTQIITSASPATPVGGLERPTGIVEYLREKRPQTSSDTILVLAGYLELHENRRPFGREDLRRLLRAARLPEPANFPRDVGVAVSKGYIQSFGEGFQLTNSGLDLVGHPGPLVAPRVRTATRGRRGERAREDDEA